MYLSLYCKGSKRLFKVCVWEGSGDRTETAIFWPPLLWPSTLCLSHSPDAQPEALVSTLLGAGFLYCILSATSLVPKLHRGSRGPPRPGWLSLPYLVYNSVSNSTTTNCNSSGAPRAPSAWCGFPYHISSISPPTLTGTVLTSVLTELYNSSTPTQSPTRSLKSHVGSSSSGNNCHAVQRSLSYGASVYECTMGIFLPRPISSANFRSRDFLS